MISFDAVWKNATKNQSLSSLEKSLRPGGASQMGFMGQDEDLHSVLYKDYQLLSSLGTTYEEMASLAQKVLDQNDYEQIPLFTRIKRRLVDGVTKPLEYNSKRFSLLKIVSLGSQHCPWDVKHDVDSFGYYSSGGGHVVVFDREQLREKFMEKENDIIDVSEGVHDWLSEQYLIVTDLTPHLIANYHFFQGNTPFRTDPEKLYTLAKNL